MQHDNEKLEHEIQQLQSLQLQHKAKGESKKVTAKKKKEKEVGGGRIHGRIHGSSLQRTGPIAAQLRDGLVP